MSVYKSFLKWADRCIIQSYPGDGYDLALTRIVFCAFLLSRGLPDYTSLAQKYPVFYSPPPGLASLTPMSYDPVLWQIWSYVVGALLIMMAVGLFTKVSSVLFSIISVLAIAKLYSFGKIDHGLFAYLTPLLLGLAGWGNKWSLDSLLFNTTGQKIKRWLVAYLALCLGTAFVTAGLPKIVGGWLNPNILMTKGFIVRKLYLESIDSTLSQWLIAHDVNWLFKLFDYGTVAFEMAFIFLIFSRKYAPWILFVTCSFHIGVQLTMGIVFTGHMMSYLPFIFAFMHARHIIDRLKKRQIIYVTGVLLVAGLFIFDKGVLAIFILSASAVLINHFEPERRMKPTDYIEC